MLREITAGSRLGTTDALAWALVGDGDNRCMQQLLAEVMSDWMGRGVVGAWMGEMVQLRCLSRNGDAWWWRGRVLVTGEGCENIPDEVAGEACNGDPLVPQTINAEDADRAPQTLFEDFLDTEKVRVVVIAMALFVFSVVMALVLCWLPARSSAQVVISLMRSTAHRHMSVTVCLSSCVVVQRSTQLTPVRRACPVGPVVVAPCRSRSRQTRKHNQSGNGQNFLVCNGCRIRVRR